VALEHIRQFGFALAGGHAVQATGWSISPSAHVDLFPTAISEEQVVMDSKAAVNGFRADG
jgi:hypothetical protein